MAEVTYTVTGMTCEHCVRAVTEEVGKIDGVTEVSVDLPSGAVTVTGSQEPGLADVRAAVEEAGYELTAA
ncbi:heavy-metal-associated domain-containing protein [Amycolatopsis nigrescens]|uniref:heavy-metal-associated domain-containing protein n=1 Tax=Amycolatopsis nigrescens TaxID=381445 RepID=UPI000381C004|nr:heavy-metal-associated domain-containing protein [Amycolatopsis nigrescens]